MTVHRPIWARPFLAALARTGVIRTACEVAGISRSSITNLSKADPSFEAEMRDAIEDATDTLEAEARRRAIEGIPTPVYQGGALVGTKQEYSDSLMALLLKGNRPKYGTRRVEAAGALGAATSLDPATRANRVAELVALAQQRQAAGISPSDAVPSDDDWEGFV